MTSPATPPSRRRRRIVVVVAVLVLGVLFVSWRLGSSGVDKRFVGKWVDKDGLVLSLNADGHLFTTAGGETDDWGQRWWISGNRLVVYSPTRSRFDNAHNWLKYFVRRVTGKPQWGRFEDCLITEFDRDTLQLHGELEMKRVPESARP